MKSASQNNDGSSSPSQRKKNRRTFIHTHKSRSIDSTGSGGSASSLSLSRSAHSRSGASSLSLSRSAHSRSTRTTRTSGLGRRRASASGLGDLKTSPKGRSSTSSSPNNYSRQLRKPSSFEAREKARSVLAKIEQSSQRSSLSKSLHSAASQEGGEDTMEEGPTSNVNCDSLHKIVFSYASPDDLDKARNLSNRFKSTPSVDVSKMNSRASMSEALMKSKSPLGGGEEMTSPSAKRASLAEVLKKSQRQLGAQLGVPFNEPPMADASSKRASMSDVLKKSTRQVVPSSELSALYADKPMVDASEQQTHAPKGGVAAPESISKRASVGLAAVKNLKKQQHQMGASLSQLSQSYNPTSHLHQLSDPNKANKRAGVSMALRKKPSLESQAAAVMGANLSERAPDSPVSNNRPSRFSTSSSLVARSFLQDDSAPDHQRVDNPPPTTTTKDAEDPHPGLLMFLQDNSEYSEVMSLQESSTSSKHTQQQSDTDLEWNPEAQRQQEEEWRKHQRRHHKSPFEDKSSNTTSSDTRWGQRPDLREVDQTVNLMDASADDLDFTPTKAGESANASETGNSWFRQVASSGLGLADLFFDEPSDNTGKKRRKRRTSRWKRTSEQGQTRRRRCCIFALTLLIFLGAVLGALVAWHTGVFAPDKESNEEATAQASVTDTTAPQATVDPVDAAIFNTIAETTGEEEIVVEEQSAAVDDGGVTSQHHSLLFLLLEMDISTSAEVKKVNSPQYLAWNWINRLKDPAQLCVTPPADDAELEKVLLEAYSLAVLYFATNGDLTYNTASDPSQTSIWTDHTNWMKPTPICNWYGLECEGDTHIVHLNMSQNNLVGSVPRELKVLTDLRTLDLGGCGLEGTLPEDIWPNLKQLEYLWMHQNKLVGTLPTTLGTMTNLISLKMFKNALEGQLPAQLNAMTSLHTLSLQENRFGGTIPYLADLRNLEVLELQSNQLVKDIPAELFSFLKLKDLRVSRNHLTGTIPPEMHSLSELRILAFDNNELKGSLDDTFDHFDYLEELHLHNNKLSGKIPKSFGHLSLLRHLTLDNNQMTGTIPTELALMTELKEVRLYFNRLTGELPPEICDLKTDYQLEYLQLDCQRNQNFGCSSDDQCCDECM